MGRMCEFVNEFVKTHNQEEEDQVIWEFWLHRVWDKSLEEFKESLKANQAAAPQQSEMEEIIKKSFDMLEGFSLLGGAEDGTIQTAWDDSD